MEFCVDGCLSSCKENIVYCFQTCKKNYGDNIEERRQCNSQCSELSDVCQSNCTEIPSDSLYYMNNCINENGCGDYPFFKKDCLEEKKGDIFSCYSQFCSPLNKQKCIKNADILYKQLTTSPIDYEIMEKNKSKKEEGNVFMFLLFLMLVLVVIKMIFFG